MSLEILNKKNNNLLGSKISSIDKSLGALESIRDMKSFSEISYETKFGVSQKCLATQGNFYATNMDISTLFNDISNRTNEKFFFYYQKYALENPSVDLNTSPTTLGTITTSYTPPKYYEYQYGSEKKRTQITVELNKRPCYVDLKNVGVEYVLAPENKEINFTLKYIYTDYLDKRNFDEHGEFTIEKEYNAIIIKTADPNAFVSMYEKLGFALQAKSKIISLFVKAVQKTTDGKSLKFIYENMPSFVIEELLNNLFQEIGISINNKRNGENEINNPVEDLLWKHLEILSNHDDKGIFSFTRDSSGALLNLLKVFKNSQFLFQNFQKNQTLVKRIFNNLNSTSIINDTEWSNKTLFANFITALCTDNAFEGLRILSNEFTIGKDYAVSSGSIFQSEKDNTFFLQQLQKKAEKKTIYTPGIVPGNPGRSEEVTSYYLEETEEGSLYHPMDMVHIKYADIKETPLTLVSAITIKAFAEERDQQLRADAVRIGFDVLAIALGLFFPPAGGAIGVAAEAIGIGLALADIGITLKREDILLERGGKEFLEYWEKVYLVGGLALAPVAMVEQVFAKSVFCYLEALKNGRPSTFLEAYQKSLGKILLEREILTFAGNTLKPSTEISINILAYNSKEIAKATGNIFDSNLLPLYEKGAILVKVGDNEYALVYKGEKLIQGTSNDKKLSEFYRKLKKNQKRLDEFLEESRHEGGAYGESIIATTVDEEIKAFEKGAEQFKNKTIAKPFEKMKEAMPYFNHKSVGNAIRQIGRLNCGNTVEVVVEFLRTGKLRLAEPSGYQGLEEVAEKFGGGYFQPNTIPRMKELMEEGDIVVIYGVKNKYRIKGTFEDSTVGHYFVGMKKDGELHLFDGQTGEYVVYDATIGSKARNYLQRGYEGGFRFLKIRK